MNQQTETFGKRFIKNKPALAGFLIISVFTLLAILGFIITPDSTPMANSMNLSIAVQKPGFTINMLKVPIKRGPEKSSFLNTMLFGREADHRFLPYQRIETKDGKISLQEYTSGEDTTKIITIIPVEELDAGLLRLEPSGQNSEIEKRFTISKTFLLGTDRFGRDMLSRMIIGGRISLSVGLIAVFISLLIGLTLGMLAGYYRGKVDAVILWLINVIWSLPTLLLVIAFTMALGKGFWQIFVAVGLSMWVEVARVVRGQVFSIREKEYIEAARAFGYSDLRIIVRHILPNITAPIIVICAANFASAILLEAGLSFLGLGVQPPMPSWGMMIKDHYGFIVLDAAYLAVIPGVAIMLLVMAFNFIGNGLRDAMDVTLK